MENTLQSNPRNPGIDLLRMTSMLMVVILHVLGAGGVLDAVTPYSLSYYSVWALEILCYCAVNVFAVISGYVGIKSRHKPASLATLTLQVLLYTALFTVLVGLAFPGTLTVKDWIRAAYPFQHWYFASYFCLFFFLPLINRGLQALSHGQRLWLCAVMTLLLCLIPTLVREDVFVTGVGYSPLWLAYMYVLGATLRLNGTVDKLHGKIGVLVYVAAMLLTLGSKIFMEFFTPLIFDQVRGANVLIRYDSPTMVAAAIGLLILFAKCNLKGFAKKLVAFFSPLAFGVYIIHFVPVFKDVYLVDKCAPLAQLPAFLIPFAAIGIAFAIYLACTVLEIPRFYLFRWLKIKQRFDRLFDRIGKRIFARTQ